MEKKSNKNFHKIKIMKKITGPEENKNFCFQSGVVLHSAFSYWIVDFRLNVLRKYVHINNFFLFKKAFLCTGYDLV